MAGWELAIPSDLNLIRDLDDSSLGFNSCQASVLLVENWSNFFGFPFHRFWAKTLH